MTKKDYVKIAEVLKSERPEPNWLNKWAEWVLIVRSFARMLAEDNPLFNEYKFYKACDYDPEE